MKRRILIADSGSTKTDWCVMLDGVVIKQIKTNGMNPYFQSKEDIRQELVDNLLPQLSSLSWLSDDGIDAVFFYGAGCTTEKRNVISEAVSACLPGVRIEVSSDLWAAARSLCGHEAGIACILGTGSNSCFYDGKEIVKAVSPLGFILGDEGSGAVLGKLLVGDILKNQLPAHIQKAFLKECRLTVSDIIDRVYNQPFPNRFLAALSPFIARHLDEPALRQLVRHNFASFLHRNVMQYDYREHPVHFTGSIAHCYREILQEAAQEVGIRVGKIQQSPMEGLITYHAQ